MLYLRMALFSAESMRKVEPSVPITLMTSEIPLKAQVLLLKTFTSITVIPKDMLYPGRQWITRAEAMRLSPYKITLAVDSDTFACTPFAKDLAKIADDLQIDIAFGGHEPRHSFPIHPDNGIIVYRNGPRLDKLLDSWTQRMKSMLDANETDLDDQNPLKSVLLDGKSGVTVGRLATSIACRLRPAKNTPWTDTAEARRRHDHTLIISGPVRILHMRDQELHIDNICQLINQDKSERIYVWDKSKIPYPNAQHLSQAFQVAHSQEECDRLLGVECVEFKDWSPQPLITKLGRHLHIPKSQEYDSPDAEEI